MVPLIPFPGLEVGRLSLLIKNGLVVTQDPRRAVLNADVLVEDSRISQVGSIVERADDYLDASGCIVMPGLINCHTHVSMALMRSVADDMPLEDFLTRTFEIDSRRTSEDIETGATLGCLEMARTGTTCLVDLYYSEDVIAKSVEHVGLRACLGWAVLDDDKTTQKGSPLSNCEEFIRQHRGRELVRPVVAPQGVYVCSDDTLMAAKELAQREGTFCHMHLSETRHEVYEYQRTTGERPAEHLDIMGFFSMGDLVAHGVWLTVNELRALGKAGVSVAHCPTSNMKLAGGGVAPLIEMAEAGVGVCLGTDGCSSNNGLDMFLEMKFASLLQKAHRWDASAVPAQKALDMATVDAARAIGAGDDLGSIEPGKKADIVVIDTRTPGLVPTRRSNAVANIVYAAASSSVRDTIVDGRFVLRDRVVVNLDEDRVLDEADIAAARLMPSARARVKKQ
jgi:5-methylthioadenosine/S-adenosylhomocysteine deaminase